MEPTGGLLMAQVIEVSCQLHVAAEVFVNRRGRDSGVHWSGSSGAVQTSREVLDYLGYTGSPFAGA